MTTRRPPVIPEIVKAYQNDPRTQLTVQSLANGTSTAPVAQGKYGMADGIARVLTSLAGAYGTKKQMERYSDEETKTIADQQDILRRTLAHTQGAVPGAPPAAPMAPPAPAMPPPAMPQAQGAPPQAVQAAAALGAPPAPQAAPAGPPGGPVGLPAPGPVPMAPQAMGGGPRKPPFGSAPAVAGGSRNAPWIAPPELEQVPDVPAPVERPKAPEAVKATRSRLLDAAYETIMNGNPYLFARGQDMFDRGSEEQTKLDEAAGEREQKLRDMGYQTDLSDYADSRSASRSDAYARRREAEGRNFQATENFKSRVFQHGEGETERAFQATENARNRAAARINASIAASARSSKPLSFTAAEKLAGHAAVLDGAERLQQTFDKRFVGHVVAGQAAVLTNRIVGGDKEQAGWWQDYDSWVAQVRHDLYGASLTNNEKAAFEKTIVTARTNPGVAAQNLERQRAIVATGLARQARAAAVSYGLDAVNEAIGRDATQLHTAAPPASVTTGTPAAASGAGWGKAQVVGK